MITLFLQKPQKNRIEAIKVDATLSESSEFSNIISMYPVEQGVNTTDHIKQQSIRLSLSGITSATPVEYYGIAVTDLVQQNLTNRINDTFKLLLGYAGFKLPDIGNAFDIMGNIKYVEPQLITIVTNYMVYNNMAIQRIIFPRDPSTGSAIRYNIDFVQIRKVSSQTTIMSITSELGGKAKNIQKRSQNPINSGKNTINKVKETSIPKQLYDKLGGVIKGVIQ